MKLQRHMKMAIGSASAALFGLIFGWVIFPVVLKAMLKKGKVVCGITELTTGRAGLIRNIKQLGDNTIVVGKCDNYNQEMALTKKTDVRKMWEQIPFSIDFKVYLFNYTNYKDVQNGATPIVKEIGPYHFDEWKEKVDITDYKESDTITYRKLDKFYFRPDLSGQGLTGEETVVIPHVIALSLVNVVLREKPALISTVGKAIDGLFDKPDDVFLHIKVMDVLFRGYAFDCAKKEFAPKAVCTNLKKENVSGIEIDENNQVKFSLFGMRNSTIDNEVVTVKRGKQNVMEVGSVVALDGKTQMDIWTDKCNEFDGTDGTVFPPFLTEHDYLKTYSGDLCRSFKATYQTKTKYKGIKTNRYVANIGDLANDPELKCFCDADGCPKKGLMYLRKCLGAPLYASLPHFLDCDPELLKNVKGLSPNISEHGIEIDFEPISGTPMVAKQRVQFNLQLAKADKLELFKNLPDTITPVFWVEEGLALNKTFVNMLKHQLFIPKLLVKVFCWMLLVFGTIGVILSVMYHHKEKLMKTLGMKKNSAAKVKPLGENNGVSSGLQPPEVPAKTEDVSIDSQSQPVPTRIEM